MNTLSRATTARIFAEPSQFAALRRRWQLLVTSDRRHELTAAHHLLYAALRGRDWRRGFTPIRRRSRLANGAFPGWPLFSAIGLIHSPQHADALLAPFDGLVTPAMLAELRALLPRPIPYRLDPVAVAEAGLPFDAYIVPEDGARG